MRAWSRKNNRPGRVYNVQALPEAFSDNAGETLDADGDESGQKALAAALRGWAQQTNK